MRLINGFYTNKPDSSEFRYISLISQFNLRDSVFGAIEIEVVSKKELKLKFNNGSEIVTRSFKGEYNNGQFGITLEKWSTGVPLINFRTKKELIWLTLTDNSQLLIDRYTSWMGSIFIVTAGDSYESRHKYSRITQ